MRSFLFVPADNERKLLRADSTAADALVYDLEDSVLPERKATGRQLLTSHLQGRAPSERTWIRVNGVESSDLLLDLAVAVALRPAGIVLPKIRGPDDVRQVSDYLTMAETMVEAVPGTTKIIAVCTETPIAVLQTANLATARLTRLAGLMWGAEDLSSILGASDPRTADGTWRPVYQHARTQCLLAAHALNVLAVDTVFVDVRDPDGCRQSAEQARADGFTSKIAIHPDQATIINEVFTPNASQVDRARRIVAAFRGAHGAVVLDGKMLDIPHLSAARRLLESIQMSKSDTS
jgi:citrate lyase subunit beta/citryl-CoA lyase